MSAPQPPKPVSPLASYVDVTPHRAVRLPLAFIVVLAGMGLSAAVPAYDTVKWSFLGAAAVLLVWCVALLASARSRGRTFKLDIVLRSQHYVQMCAHGAIFIYWGAYWQTVYDSAGLILAQIFFAYAFDALLNWSRRDNYALGFGPVPIIGSVNLFLWFKPEWFYLQFILVAMGLLVKEFVRWNKDGRRVHIFNPSSFPLAFFSLVLLTTGQSDISWGPQITLTQHHPPHIYLLIFLVSLPGQYLFGVTLMTMSAVITTYLFGVLWFPATGVDFTYTTHIPIAVFLGMHLLFNDPSTSPRSSLGRIIYGILYGLSVVVLYTLLQSADQPTFYDKLLQVPILNLLAQRIDRFAALPMMQRLDPTRRLAQLAPRRRNLVYITIWVVVFSLIQTHTGESQRQERQLARRIRLLEQGQVDQAIANLDATEQSAVVLVKAGKALMTQRRFQDAADVLQRAVKVTPNDADAHHDLAFVLAYLGQTDAAIRHYEQAIRLKPDWPRPMTSLALLRASHPIAAYRDADQAIALATRAVELSQAPDPMAHNALAAAYAAAGRFDDAVHAAEQAATIAAASSPQLAARIRSRADLYRNGQTLYDARMPKAP